MDAGYSEYEAKHLAWAYKNADVVIDDESRETEKGIIWPDIQWPEHNRQCCDVVLQFAEDYQPDYMIYLGDQLEMDMLSSWKQKKFIPQTESIKDHCDGFNNEILSEHEKIVPNAHRIWFDGNHEARADWYLDAHPQFRQLIEPRNVLGLKKRGYEIIRYKGVYKFGKCRLFHGFYWNMHHCKRTVEDIMHSCVYGDTHTLQAYTKMSPVDSLEYYMAISLPCLANINPHWRRGQPNRWVNGFGVIEKFEDRNFNVYPVVINNGRFAWNGKVYK
jgi:hypothetical protein